MSSDPGRRLSHCGEFFSLCKFKVPSEKGNTGIDQEAGSALAFWRPTEKRQKHVKPHGSTDRLSRSQKQISGLKLYAENQGLWID